MKLIKSLIATMAGMLLLGGCQSSDTSSLVEYIPFKSDKDNNWGLISPEGKVLFDDEFESLPTLVTKGRFFVQSKDGYELYAAEEKPKQVCNTVWKEACIFIEDVAPAVEKGKCITLIDRNGKVVKEIDKLNNKVVTSMTNFTGGLSVYCTIEGYYGLVNPSGKVVADAEYSRLLLSQDGVAVGINKKYEAEAKQNEKDKIHYTVIDPSGKAIADISGKKVDEISGYYHDGLMVASVKTDEDEVKCGLLNLKGEWEVKPSIKVKHIGEWRGKNMTFLNDEGKYGVMTFDGEVLIRAKYDGLFFIDDKTLAAYDNHKDSEESWKLINLEGEQVGEDTFSGLFSTGLGKSENLLVSIEENDYGFMSKGGKYVDLPKNLDIYDISLNEGCYTVESDYVDFAELVNALKITATGLDGYTLGAGAEATVKEAASRDSDISTDPSNYNYRSSISYSKDFKVANAGIQIQFDNNIATDIKQTVTENFYGYLYSYEKVVGQKFSNAKVTMIGASFSTNSGKLEGKGKDFYKAAAAKFKQLGKTVKSNNNAIIVDLGKGNYGIAIYTGEEVALGVYTGSKDMIDISRYENVSEKNPESASLDYVPEEVVEEVAVDTTVAAEVATPAK